MRIGDLIEFVFVLVNGFNELETDIMLMFLCFGIVNCFVSCDNRIKCEFSHFFF